MLIISLDASEETPTDRVTFYNPVNPTMPSTCSIGSLYWNYAEQFTCVRSLRPASRDMSDDARSGNTNPAILSEDPTRRSNPTTMIASGQARIRCGQSRHIFSSRCIRTGKNQKVLAKLAFLKRMSLVVYQLPSNRTQNHQMVELSGIEPLTPCLQSRCSPS